MENSEDGIINPDSFIQLVEDNNFIQELGVWIIDEAIRQYVDWKKKY